MAAVETKADDDHVQCSIRVTGSGDTTNPVGTSTTHNRSNSDLNGGDGASLKSDDSEVRQQNESQEPRINE